MATRSTVHLGKRARYEGRLSPSSGERHGFGTLYVNEDGRGAISSLRVHWEHDQPSGRGCFTEPDGGRVQGTFKNGMLSGIVVEEHPDATLRFVGNYVDGLRNGEGVEIKTDGGCLVGTWLDGKLHGAAFCAYLYPCHREGLALVGEWRHGAMWRAYPVVMGAGDPPESSTTGRAGGLPPLPASAVHPMTAFVVDAVRNVGEKTLKDLLGRRDPRATAFWSWSNDRVPAPSVRHRGDVYEKQRVTVGHSQLYPTAGDGLFASRQLSGGEVVAFFGGQRVFIDGAEDVLNEDGETDSERGDQSVCSSGSEEDSDANEDEDHIGHDEVFTDTRLPPSEIDIDWCVLAEDGSWVYVPPLLRSMEEYSASLGHKANHAGWRANCELVPFEHPIFGRVRAVRVLQHIHVIEQGEELTVNYSHIVGVPSDRLPPWLAFTLDQRTEDGYYAHLRFTPPRTEFCVRSRLSDHGRIRVVSHGPWRVLWFDGVEQGMTYHAADGSLVPTVVGFDYQRTMVAAVVALAVDWTGTGSICSGVLLVGLGAGSCAAAIHALVGGRTSDNPALTVEVVENDAAVVEAAKEVHGLKSRVGSGQGRIRIAVDDAELHLRHCPAARCILLDAYDAKGRVPPHLQAPRFLEALNRTLVDGGCVIANLWYGTPAAVAQSDEFVARVVQALGGPNGRRVDVYALQVVGHEKNRILLALKSPLQMEKTSAPERLHALRRRLGLAVDHHRMRNTEPTLVATMDSLVETCQRWEIR